MIEESYKKIKEKFKIDSEMVYPIFSVIAVLSLIFFAVGTGLLISGNTPTNLLQKEKRSFYGDETLSLFDLSETINIEKKTFDRVYIEIVDIYHCASDTYWVVSGYFDDDDDWVDTSHYETDYVYYSVDIELKEIYCEFNFGSNFTLDGLTTTYIYGLHRNSESLTINTYIEYEPYDGNLEYEYTKIKFYLEFGTEELFNDPYVYERKHLISIGGWIMGISGFIGIISVVILKRND